MLYTWLHLVGVGAEYTCPNKTRCYPSVFGQFRNTDRVIFLNEIRFSFTLALLSASDINMCICISRRNDGAKLSYLTLQEGTYLKRIEW